MRVILFTSIILLLLADFYYSPGCTMIMMIMMIIDIGVVVGIVGLKNFRASIGEEIYTKLKNSFPGLLNGFEDEEIMAAVDRSEFINLIVSDDEDLIISDDSPDTTEDDDTME